ncbi:MAG: hypothetical protein ACRDPW_01385 [Mycobacteriales bacterium]
MAKTTVNISDELKHNLTSVALRRHQTEAETVRDALTDFIANQPPLPQGHWGEFSSGDSEPMTAERFDAILAAGFGAEGLDRS